MLTFIAIASLSAAVLLAPGIALLWRVRRLDDRRAPLVPRRVSVIIPARDEEHNLPALLDTLREQTLAPVEVLVADDGSTDGTAAVARQGGATVVPVPDKPPGWTGKTWGCWTAAQQATGELLVFFDADTRLAPDALQRIAGSHRGGLLSVEPYHEVPRLYEQASALFAIVRAASVRAFSLLGERRAAAGAFGPCLAVGRDDYFAHQGHANAAVRGEILEHFAMGRLFAREGLPVDCYAGAGAISTRMYPGGVAELIEGWSKAFAAGSRGTPRDVMLLTVAWIAGAFQATFALLGALLAAAWGSVSAGVVILGAAVYVAHALQIGWMLRRLGGFSWLTAALFPLPLLAFVAIFARSAYLVRYRKRVTWRGRELPATENRGG